MSQSLHSQGTKLKSNTKSVRHKSVNPHTKFQSSGTSPKSKHSRQSYGPSPESKNKIQGPIMRSENTAQIKESRNQKCFCVFTPSLLSSLSILGFIEPVRATGISLHATQQQRSLLYYRTEILFFPQVILLKIIIVIVKTNRN